jgi:hypothetical protein
VRALLKPRTCDDDEDDHEALDDNDAVTLDACASALVCRTLDVRLVQDEVFTMD